MRQWDRTMTYAELVGAAARLAETLRVKGVGPETTVGVSLARTPELVVAVLGVLMAGGAYVPVDPDLPAERRTLLLRDADATIVVTADLIEAGGSTGEVSAGPAGPDNAAYVMYTSGSTGQPKGVVVTHHSVVNWVTEFARETGADELGERCRSFGFAALGFDASVIDMFVPLSVGGEIELLTEADRTDPTRLQGRVIATMWSVALGLAPVGALVSGFLAENFGIREVILVSSIIGVVVPVLLLTFSPVRRLRKMPEAPSPA